MGLFFGTDGIRGKVNADLTFDIAYKIGNALSILKDNPTVLIGSDTRVSGSYLTLGVASGAMSGGARVLDAGIVPTAGVAYLTKKIHADYGVVISASHNSAEYNGIKVFDSDGYKLGDKEEERVERCFIHEKTNDFPDIGEFSEDFSLTRKYADFLSDQVTSNLEGKTVVLDCAFGAAYSVAPEVFKRAGAKVIAENSDNDGLNINNGCGALFPENLAKRVVKQGADMGFAFDGDADRVIAVDEKGKIIDGDMIIYGLARHLKTQGKLSKNTVVGTSHTNMAIEEKLKEEGISMIRTDIGDKYVLAELIDKKLSLGGEQSGHIILKDIATTGDGILTAITVANMIASEKRAMSDIFEVDLYPQANINVVVNDKFRIMNNEILSKEIVKRNEELSGKGRIMIRASGTEPKIRIMVESKDKELNESIAGGIASLVRKIDE